MKKILILLLITIILSTNVYGQDWGLGGFKEGRPPTGTDTAQFLQKYDAFYLGKDEPVIYLTFDAGYENGYTESILDILKAHKAPGAFFLTGNYIKDNPHIIKRMVEEGHIVANHTMHHPDMNNLSKEEFEKELKLVEDIYMEVTETEMPKYYRPPKGKYNETSLQRAKDLGYKTVFWSLAYVDWDDGNQPSKEEAFSKLIPRIHPGAIILLHNTSKTNAVILDELLGRYVEMGYGFGGMEEL